jgi:hypothetical protein
MTSLRKYLKTLAALVLLVWTFSVGAAFAQACASSVDLACEGCCTEVKPATAAVDQRIDTLAPPQPQPGPPPAPLQLTLATAENAPEPLRFQPETHFRPPRIPVVFLRLAL